MQDGSCNGLQHYAALGRDELGARAVNLVPAAQPQDVYSEIAAVVERRRQADFTAGGRDSQLAHQLAGMVRRKVVKQTVMTTVYGVTRYGAKLQIRKQLKDIDEFNLEVVEQASKYLSQKTFESLNELFTASQAIQDWLTECAGVISKDCGANVSWVTPLGLPVVQPYENVTRKRVKTVDKKTGQEVTGAAPHHSKDMEEPNMFKKRNIDIVERRPNTMKHRNGFPPNFIHSLDSSHMMLTSLHLWLLGINFASVHDCFWTHAADVDEMNRLV